MFHKLLINNKKFNKYNIQYFSETSSTISIIENNNKTSSKATTTTTIKGKKNKKQTNVNIQNDARSESLAIALKKIEQSYGKGSIMRLGDRSAAQIKLDVISTGSLGLDAALGVGGLPKGRIVEIYGPEASGKTSLALHVIKESQKKGGKCTFVDAEHALDPVYAKLIGVDIDNLYVTQPDSGEQALEITDTLVRSGTMDVIVVDSVAALTPRSEIEGEMGDAHMASQARLMSQALRKLTSSVSKTNTLLIFINQIRMKVGVVFGNPEVTSGGNALKFYCSVRLDIRRSGFIKDGDKVIGTNIKVKVAKNKVGPPFKVAEFDMYFGQGISSFGEILDLGLEHGVLTKRGAYIVYKNPDSSIKEPIASLQGRVKAIEFLKENPEIYEKLKLQLLPLLISKPTDSITDTLEDDNENGISSLPPDAINPDVHEYDSKSITKNDIVENKKD